MNEKFNINVKVEKFTTMLGIAVRLIVIDPLPFFNPASAFNLPFFSMEYYRLSRCTQFSFAVVSSADNNIS